ncbi:MAG TPA: RNA-directed DNA polymerase, partial [Bryobacteraceae bacterium]|nr:RNA-directed DNA polymerase [Bryobacteraceae bacterium]
MPDNSEIDDPAGWEDITREDLFYAFRKAKTDCFYEHTVLAADRFTAYEAELFSNLNRLCDRIKAGDVDALFAENLGEVAVVAKKLNKTPNRNNRKGLHDFFSDPTKFFERLTRDTTLHPEFRLVGDFPVEMHVLSALWINLVGHRFDARLGPHVYGSRLRRYRMVDNQDTRVAGRYHREALGIFEPYFTPYKTWRNRGLGTMRAELKAGRAIIAISLDLSNYYHRIDPNFIAAPHFQAALGVNLSPWATSFTRTFADSMSNWANRTTELLKTYGCELRDDVPGGLPIGLAAARLAANVLLHQLDQAFMAGLAPIYYGRYVDDMFLVLQDSWSFGSAQDLFHWIQARVPLLQSTKREEMEIRFEPEYSAHSKITLQKSKQRVFFLSGSVGLDLLSNIESEINEVSSERRLMPDPE